MIVVVAVWVVFLVVVVLASRRAARKPLRSYDKRGSFYMKAQYTVFFTLLGRALLFPWPVGSESLSIAGQAVAVLGLVGYGLTLRTFIASYNPMVCIRERQTLCRRGAYKYVRHPLYSWQMIMMAGTGLALQHPVFLALPIPFLIMAATAKREEALLAEFHEDYAEYARQTRRFIPFVL